MMMVLVGLGAGDLVVGGDGVGLVARRRARLSGLETLAPTMALRRSSSADAVGGEPGEVGLDAHRGLDAALHRARGRRR